MEKLFEISVVTGEVYSVSGHTGDVCMVQFTGTAEGKYFSGRVVGTGTDTQKIPKGGEAFLSARYMLEGRDCDGQPCRMFIENNGTFSGGFTPRVVTDSAALAFLETAELSAEVLPCGENVLITVMG